MLPIHMMNTYVYVHPRCSILLNNRYPDVAGFDANFKNTFVGDKALTDSLSIGYAPVVWPGFSWSNLQRKNGGGAFNQIPRQRGTFWQHQAITLSRGFKKPPLFLYAAMFDEVDEGTAMFKAASLKSQTPAEGSFLYLSVDGGEPVPSDFYLALAGNFTKSWHLEVAACTLNPKGNACKNAQRANDKVAESLNGKSGWGRGWGRTELSLVPSTTSSSDDAGAIAAAAADMLKRSIAITKAKSEIVEQRLLTL